MKPVEKVVRRLSSGQLVADQLGQRLVQAKVIEVLALPTRRSQRQETFHHLRRGQYPLARLELDRAIDDGRRTRKAIRLDQARNAGPGRHQTRLQFTVDLEFTVNLEIQPPQSLPPAG